MTADSNAATDSTDMPSSGRTTVLRVGIRSSDQTLVQRLVEGLRTLDLAHDLLPENGADGSRRHIARILDLASLPDPARGWLAPGRNPGADLVLLVGDGDASLGASRATMLRLFPRREVGDLLATLSTVAETERGMVEGSALVGQSDAIDGVRERVGVAARMPDLAVLVLGESGTGKELVAREIHRLTPGARGPFVAIDGAALSPTTWAEELFGRAGRSDQDPGHDGLVAHAAGGTLFLDEVGDLPEAAQAALLRVLETRRYVRVGSIRELPLRARIVAATQRLPQGDRDRGLRADLYHRLSAFPIVLPALRERPEDLRLLAERFLTAFAERHRLPVRELRDEGLAALATHAWPGNVRELRAVLERLAASATAPVTATEVSTLVRSSQVLSQDTPMTSPLAEEVESTSRPMTLVGSPSRLASTMRPTSTASGATLKELERDIVLEALAQSNGNLSRTARKLGIARSTLRHKLRRYGIETARAQDDE